MHPSDPTFASERNANKKGYLALDSLEPALEAVVSGVSDSDPIQMLKTQLGVAREQLNSARTHLVKSRQRVGELQEVVLRLELFLQDAGWSAPSSGASVTEMNLRERYTA